MRKLKPKMLFPAILIGTVFLSMCLTSDKTDITAAVKLLPDVQQFLNEHPDAEIKAAMWSASAVETNIESIREDCGPQIESKSYWRAEVKENDLDLIIWLDSDSKQPVCAVKKRIVTATTPMQTATSTPAFTPLVTQTVAPTLTPTPIHTASPTATSAPTKRATGFASLQVKDWNVASSNGMLTLVLENKYGSQITLTGINATRAGTTNGCVITGLATTMAENQELTLTTTGTTGYGGNCAIGLHSGESYTLDVQIYFTAGSVQHTDSGTIYTSIAGAEITKSMFAGATGDQIRFILNWKNTGRADTPEVQVRDFIPTGFKLVNSTGQSKLSDAPEGQYIDWALGKIKVGDEGTLNYTIEGNGTYRSGEALLIVR